MPTEPPDGEKIAVLTPITIAFGVESRPAGIAFVDRRVDLDEVVIGAGADVAAARRTMPAVTVPPSPNGLPTAITQSPIRGALSDSFT